MARVLLLGKYPPLVGGVTTGTLSATASLLQAGHEVDVVTAGGEGGVAATSWPGWAAQFPNPLSSESLSIQATEPLPRESYIPWCDPLLSKVIGQALTAADVRKPDVVIGWYLEPFGVAASLVAALLQVPFVLRHAGSDLGRLAAHRQLRRVYRLAARQATVIMTSRRATPSVQEALGADPAKLMMRGGEPLPPWFSHTAIDEIPLADPRDWLRLLGAPDDLANAFPDPRALIQRNPTSRILSYGKVGSTKGSWELLFALERLAQSGKDFIFVAIPYGHKRTVLRYLSDLAALPSLARRTIILPPAPNWVIARLLPHMDAACCLENRFPISFHNPVIPREILAASVQLIVSAEIHAKQFLSASLRDGVNVHVVSDPRDIVALALVVERALFDENRDLVGQRGGLLARSVEQQLFASGSALVEAVYKALAQ